MRPHLKVVTVMAVAAAGLTLTSAPASAVGPEPRLFTMNGADPGDFRTAWQPRYSDTKCEKGFICLSVHDPSETSSDRYWKVFKLTKCDVIFNMQNWEGGGYWKNNQNKSRYGTVYSGLDGGGASNTMAARYADGRPSTGTFNWSPLNSVKAC